VRTKAILCLLLAGSLFGQARPSSLVVPSSVVWPAGASSGGSITHIAAADICFGGLNGATSAAVNASAANGLWMFIASLDNTVTPSDSGGNTWISVGASIGTGPGGLLYYTINPTVTASQTFTVTASGEYVGACVFGFSGMLTTSSVFQSGTQAATFASSGTSIQPGSSTPGTGHNLFILGCGNNSGTITVDSGFSIPLQIAPGGGVNYGAAISYLIQSGNTAQNPTCTTSGGSTGLSAIIAAFRGN